MPIYSSSEYLFISVFLMEDYMWFCSKQYCRWKTFSFIHCSLYKIKIWDRNIYIYYDTCRRVHLKTQHWNPSPTWKKFLLLYMHIYDVSLTFLDKTFSAAYSVPGKVHRNWAIIDMWAVWPSALIVDVGNLSTFLIKSK